MHRRGGGHGLSSPCLPGVLLRLELPDFDRTQDLLDGGFGRRPQLNGADLCIPIQLRASADQDVRFEMFAGLCICRPPGPVRMDERAGWQCWECPACGRRWDLEHFYAEDLRYLGYSFGQVRSSRTARPGMPCGSEISKIRRTAGEGFTSTTGPRPLCSACDASCRNSRSPWLSMKASPERSTTTEEPARSSAHRTSPSCSTLETSSSPSTSNRPSPSRLTSTPL